MDQKVRGIFMAPGVSAEDLMGFHPDLVRLGSASPHFPTVTARMAEDVVREKVFALLDPREGAKISNKGIMAAVSSYASGK